MLFVMERIRVVFTFAVHIMARRLLDQTSAFLSVLENNVHE